MLHEPLYLLINILSDTAQGSTYGGAHSELYSGTIIDKLPTPIPLSESAMLGWNE